MHLTQSPFVLVSEMQLHDCLLFFDSILIIINKKNLINQRIYVSLFWILIRNHFLPNIRENGMFQETWGKPLYFSYLIAQEDVSPALTAELRARKY